MKFSNVKDYVEDKSWENGWYLLIIHRKTEVATKTFNYRKIKHNRLEKITTTALKHLKKDGVLYTPKDVDQLLDYDIYLLRYFKGEVVSRFTMKYKPKISLVDGYYDGWEYTVPDKDGNFISHDNDYSWKKAFWFPCTTFIVQFVLFIIAEYYSKDNSLTNWICAFLVFYLGLIYSTFSVLQKDLIKPHYLKDNFGRIKLSVFIFEIPVCAAAVYTSYKISYFGGQPNPGMFITFAILSLVLILAKIGFTIFLEWEKKLK